jgi:pentatricopeptide repeat protein
VFVNCLHHAKLIEVPTLLEYKVGKLTSKQDVPAIKHLYEEITKGFNGPDQWLKATKGAQAPHYALLMPESAWASFIFAFIHCGQTGLGGGVWEDMLGLGLSPGAACWNALISAHGTSGDYVQCKHQFAVMKKQGVKPDAHSYRALIFSLYSAHKCEDAMFYFEEFRTLQAGFSMDDQLMVYNVTLNGLLRHVKEDPQNEAIGRRLFDSMRANGPKPDLRSYNILLAYYGRRKMLKACAQTLELMTSDGLIGDVYTYTIILSAMLRAGRVDAREIVLRTMRAQGIQPNSGTYTNIITDMVKDGTEDNIVDAMNEITRLEASRDKDVHPNEITYTAVINAIVRNTDLSPQLKDDYIQHLRDRMKQRGIVPNRTTFHNLIAASLDDPMPSGIHRAMSYYKEMGERGIHMVQDSWYILIQGMANRGEYGLAHQLIRDMVISGFKPSGSLLRVVDRVRMEAR